MLTEVVDLYGCPVCGAVYARARWVGPILEDECHLCQTRRLLEWLGRLRRTAEPAGPLELPPARRARRPKSSRKVDST